VESCADHVEREDVVADPNDLLRRARERVESPHASGDCVSRQELAELVNAWVYEHHRRVIELDANYIGKLEQGTIRWMRDPERRAAFRALLGAATDAELGFRRPRRSRTTVDDVDRQQFLRVGLGITAAAAAGKSTIAELVTQTQPTPIPSFVGMTHVADVRRTAKAFEDWDAHYGGGLVREAATAQLCHCARLLNARCSETVRSAMLSAVGYFGHVTAFMALDTHAHEDARRLFGFAQSCAEESEDWQLRAKVLNSLASHAICRQEPDDALTFTELALVRADRLSATERAMLHTVRAHGLGMLGRAHEAMRAVDVADREFSYNRSIKCPPWMASYDLAHHHGETGRALWQTARHGHFADEARDRLQSALDGYRTSAMRARTRSQVKQASLIMATGDPAEATALGMRGLEAAGTLRSRRTLDDLRELRRFAEPHAHRSDVAELRHRIGAVVADRW
jgi:hypothetical protein